MSCLVKKLLILLFFLTSKLVFSDEKQIEVKQDLDIIFDHNVSKADISVFTEAVQKALEVQKDKSINYDPDGSKLIEAIQKHFESQEKNFTDPKLFTNKKDTEKILNEMREHLEQPYKYDHYNLDIFEVISKSFEESKKGSTVSDLFVNQQYLGNTNNELQRYILTSICDKPYNKPPKNPSPDDRYTEENQDKLKPDQDHQNNSEPDKQETELDKIRKEYGCP